MFPTPTHLQPLRLSSHYSAGETQQLITEGYVGNEAEFNATFEVGEIVGRGTSSVVRVVRHRGTGNVFACKVVDKSMVQRDRVRAEVEILMNARHENVVSLHAVYETELDLRLIVDYVPGGELFDRILSKKFYSEREASEVIAQLLSAISYLNARNIVHRDIKPENILLASEDSDTNIKLSDFGLAKIFEPTTGGVSGTGSDRDMVVTMETGTKSPLMGGATQRQRAYTTLGTDWYIAPEILSGTGYEKQVDMWSVGVVMYILLCGFPPFADSSGDVGRVYTRIRMGDYSFPSPYWDAVSDSAKDLVRKLLTVDPEQRISCRRALAHPWIAARSNFTLENTPLSPHHALMFKKFHKKHVVTTDFAGSG